MHDDGPAPIGLGESVELVHAVVDRIARDNELRMLAIKGPALTRQGLREPRESVDVDVLVHPRDRNALLASLRDHGWVVEVEPTRSTVMPRHSTTLRHPWWSIELDVHHSFPGFLAPSADVFEELWGRRTTVSIAHREIDAPTPLCHATVAALHWLRDGEGAAQHRLARLVDAVRPTLDDDRRAELIAFVAATGSGDTLAPFLSGLGVIPPASAYDVSSWRLRTRSTGMKAVGWVVELRSTPWRRRPARLWRALVLTEPEIRQAQPDAAPGQWGLLRARAARIRSGLRDLPRAVGLVRREANR